MMLEIAREPSTEEGTFGKAELLGDDSLDLVARWESLELPWFGNTPGVSCIPLGTYIAKVYDSPHFGRKVYLLQDVPDRQDIELHPLNWAGDASKGWYTDSKGCMGIGMSRGTLTPPDTGRAQNCILSSTAALNALLKFTNGADIEIKIINGAQPAPLAARR